MPDINEKHVIYYAVRGYRTGQDVTLDIYDTVGTKEIDSQSMDEMGSLGIHTFNFRPRKRTAYVAVMDCTNFARKVHQVIRVEKQKIGGAVRIQRVRIPDPSFKEKEKIKLFKVLEELPTRFPKPIFPKPLQNTLSKQNLVEMFFSFKKEILSKIPKPSKIPTEMFEGLLEKYSNSMDARFEPLANELNRLIILSDEITVNQKLNFAKYKVPLLSPEQEEVLLEKKYGNK